MIHKIITYMISVFTAVTASFNFNLSPKPHLPTTKKVQARQYGELEIDINVPSGKPIFIIQNWLPGDCVSKTFTATNQKLEVATLAMKGFANINENQISEVINFQISSNNTNYFNHNLSEFVALSINEDGVSLGSLGPGENQTYEIESCFSKNASNKYQNSKIMFDLIWGESFDTDFELPPECSHLESKISKKIEGNERDNRLEGTHESELIVGYNGNDRIDGGAGDDCIVGGEGNDRLEGGSGDDVILGKNGNDRIDGGSGNDKLFGGQG